MFANVWWLGEVPPCRMFKFSTKACGGILKQIRFGELFFVSLCQTNIRLRYGYESLL